MSVQLVPDPAIGEADQVGRDRRTLGGAPVYGDGPAADRQETTVGAHGDGCVSRCGGQGQDPQLGTAPLVEIGPLPAAAIRLAGPGAAQVQQPAGRRSRTGGGSPRPGRSGRRRGAARPARWAARAAEASASCSLAPPRVPFTSASAAIRPATSTEAIVAAISTAVSTPAEGRDHRVAPGPAGSTARRPRPAAPGSARRRGTAAGPRPSPRPSRSGRPGPSRSPSGRSSPGRGGSRVDRPRPGRLDGLDLLGQRQRGRASRRPAGGSAARRGSGPARRRRRGRPPSPRNRSGAM